VLEQKDKELVTVEEELNFAKTYMELLAMRFENSVTFSLPKEVTSEEFKVVPLSLQLLLENTIKHNIASDTQPLHISITMEEGFLVVSNNLQKKEVLQRREGVGLKNIVNRYAILTDKQVRVESNEQHFKVKLPILTKQLNIMKNTSYNETDAYFRAQKRVNDIKEFYGNLLSYLFVIPFLIFINYRTYWEFQWFWFPLFGWGLGVVFHGFSVFGYGQSWEERKIREFMEQDKNNQHKWK
ncbi:MAG: 2TM domain-containing protein, partial [Flavobacterium sp.]